MKTITDITPQKNDKKRVNLYLDGVFFSGVEKIIVMSYNLNVGDEISEKRITEIIEESEYTSAFERASKYITKGSHTKKQVAGYLKNKGFDGKIIFKVINKLESYGYLDDSQFAKSFVELRQHKHGKRLLEVELLNRGVDQDIVKTCLDNVLDEDANAYNVAKKYVKDKPIDFELKTKCFRYLVSKGFNYDIAKSAIEKLERERFCQ